MSINGSWRIKTDARECQGTDPLCSNPSGREHWRPEEVLLETWEEEAAVVLVGTGAIGGHDLKNVRLIPGMTLWISRQKSSEGCLTQNH